MTGEHAGRDKRQQTLAEAERRRKVVLIAGVIGLAILVPVGILLVKAWGKSGKGTTDPPAKLRLEKVFELYQSYSRQKKKPPPNEQAFKDFLAALDPQEKTVAHLGDDVDDFLTSPRDGRKFVIRYGIVPDVGGATRAVAWEEIGRNGKRFVALSVGYVQECDEETFQSYRR
jgi:hypothetical protein